MKKEQELVEKYTKIFHVSEDRKLYPFPMFGIECGSGWYNILNALCFQIQQHIDRGGDGYVPGPGRRFLWQMMVRC